MGVDSLMSLAHGLITPRRSNLRRVHKLELSRRRRDLPASVLAKLERSLMALGEAGYSRQAQTHACVGTVGGVGGGCVTGMWTAGGRAGAQEGRREPWSDAQSRGPSERAPGNVVAGREEGTRRC